MVAPDIIVDEGRGTKTILLPQPPTAPKVAIGVGGLNKLKTPLAPSAPPIITIGGQTVQQVMAILGGMHIPAAPQAAADDVPVHVIDLSPKPVADSSGPLL